MKYKIVIDSCGELPFQYQNDIRFERVPLGLEVEGEVIMDDENFDQADFLKKRGSSGEMSEVILSVTREIYGGLPD